MRRGTGAGKGGIDWGAARQRLERAQAGMRSALEPDDARSAELLAERARRLSRGDESGLAEEASVTLVFFQCGASRYGIEVESVHRVAALPPLTPVAGAPRQFLGVIPWPGRILPVAGVEELIGHGGSTAVPGNGMVLVLGGERAELGLLSTGVERVEAVPALRILPLSGASDAGGIVRGVLADGTLVLDGRRLLEETMPAPTEAPGRNGSRKGNGADAPVAGRVRCE